MKNVVVQHNLCNGPIVSFSIEILQRLNRLPAYCRVAARVDLEYNENLRNNLLKRVQVRVSDIFLSFH